MFRASVFNKTANPFQLQDKIVQLENKTTSTVSSVVQSAKSAVGLGAAANAPRMVIMGPPGAGEFRTVEMT